MPLSTWKFGVFCLLLCYQNKNLPAQSFYFGADLSYVNEMQDCGVVYKENNTPQDPYRLFAAHGCNLVRLRLWHNPSWYDNLNSGKRYSDLQDVKRSIRRAKEAGMQVLLNFHLSDNWADPNKQGVPAAWLGVVNDLSLLKDSLQQYISQTLLELNEETLLPDMVQIGNETNKGILLSPIDDTAGWILNWNRNAQLFNAAIQAVRSVEKATNETIKVALHIAGPADAINMVSQFWNNGVQDFDVIGMSYYWAWHKPTTIQQTGDVIAQLLQTYPNKEVMIFETGYIWTNQSNDNANNIISEVHPHYSPASPENQRKFLIDLAQEVIDRGGKGLIYWEPAWVSSACQTQWGQGSHQEHAAFFDFDNNLIATGGIGWMTHRYENVVNAPSALLGQSIKIYLDTSHRILHLKVANKIPDHVWTIQLLNPSGKIKQKHNWQPGDSEVRCLLPELPPGVYFVAIYGDKRLVFSEKIWINPH